MAKLSLGVMLLLGMLMFLAHRSYAKFEEAAKESIRKQLSNDFDGGSIFTVSIYAPAKVTIRGWSATSAQSFSPIALR